MTDLSDFLLARIAEDEADAMVGWRWKALSEGEYARLQSRVLAESDAKRRIVEEIQEAADGGRHTSYITPMFTSEDVLALLALPYADHPDYDPAWRP